MFDLIYKNICKKSGKNKKSTNEPCTAVYLPHHEYWSWNSKGNSFKSRLFTSMLVNSKMIYEFSTSIRLWATICDNTHTRCGIITNKSTDMHKATKKVFYFLLLKNKKLVDNYGNKKKSKKNHVWQIHSSTYLKKVNTHICATSTPEQIAEKRES